MLAADTGVVRFEDGVWLRPSAVRLAALGVFLVPDQGALCHSMSVHQQLRLLRDRFGGVSIERAAEQLGISQWLDARPQELSSGERRRAELTAALVRGPRVLLADEPLRGISPIDAEVVMKALQEIAAAGTAVVVTGHDVETLFEGADHITWSTSGTTYELGTPAQARAHEGFRVSYLGR